MARLTRRGDAWVPTSLLRLRVDGGRVALVRDYVHCPWLVPALASPLLLVPPGSPPVTRINHLAVLASVVLHQVVGHLW